MNGIPPRHTTCGGCCATNGGAFLVSAASGELGLELDAAVLRDVEQIPQQHGELRRQPGGGKKWVGG